MSKKLTNEEFRARLFSITNKIVPIDEYKGMSVNINFKCDKGHVFNATPHNILNRLSCPVCSQKRIIAGYNDLWTVRPDLAELLANKEDGYANGVGSHKKVEFICPNCGEKSKKEISKIASRGFNCDYCSDGISFPNKILRYILKNHTDKFIFEYSPDWVSPMKYDGYFECDNKSYIVEMDGSIGHGNYEFGNSNIDVTGIERDQTKDRLALEHNIHVVRIDCNYPSVETRFEYIKNNILNSDLCDVVNVFDINWNECFTFAASSLLIEAANMYNNGASIKEISEKLNIDRHTTTSWLKQAVNIGICDYNSKDANTRGHKYMPKNAVAVDQCDRDWNVIRTFVSVAEAERITGISNIFACIYGRQKSSGGYLWKVHED